MLADRLYGRLLSTQPGTMPVLSEIRNEYSIPEIRPDEDGLRFLLRYHLEINRHAVHAQILRGLKNLPKLPPDRTERAYEAFKTFKGKGLFEPELRKGLLHSGTRSSSWRFTDR